MFENGAGGDTAGGPVAAFERSFGSFPLPGTTARSWYLGADGSLSDAKPPAAGEDSFNWDASARPATSFTGDTGSGAGGLWTATPPYQWTQNPEGKALSYSTAPLTADTAVVGAGKLQAWIKASTPDVELQVTVTEIRPDGKETFVQGGWLRASGRKLDPKKSTLLAPIPSFRKVDAAPLPSGEWAEVNVPLYYEGHMYRAGSRIRIIVSAPGGDQPVWEFGKTTPKGQASVSISRAPARASRLVLPVIPGVSAPTPIPPCPSLRGQPCRDYVPLG
jgi:putative CocE/NonD family hydrolase